MPAETNTFQSHRDQLARNPGDAGLLYACCTAGEYDALDEAVDLLRQRLAAPPLSEALRLNELHLLAHLREKQGRLAAGLSVTNAADGNDLDFKMARAELESFIHAAQAYLTRYPTTSGADVLLAEGLVSAGRIAEAEVVLASLRAKNSGNLASVTTFDPAFHASLDSLGAQVAAKLPPLKILKAVDNAATRIIHTAADYLYFEKYGWALLDTFTRYSESGIWFDLHIMDMTPAETEATLRRLAAYDGLQWGLSTEWTNLREPGPREPNLSASAKARGYYHAGRLIRLGQLLSRHPNAAVWMLDTDMLFAGDARRLFDCLEGYDVVLGLSPGRFEVRNKVCLSFSGFAPTARTRVYVQRVAGYVGHYLGVGRLPWGIDQVAMYTVWAKDTDTPPFRVRSLPQDVCDTGRTEGCVLWPAKPAR